MNELPPAARAVLGQVRAAHDPSDQEVARSLERLHASLSFAPELGASADPLAEPRAGLTPGAHGTTSVVWSTAKLAKLALVVAALGGSLGGAWLLASRDTTVPAANESAAPTAAAETTGSAFSRPGPVAVPPAARAAAASPAQAAGAGRGATGTEAPTTAAIAARGSRRETSAQRLASATGRRTARAAPAPSRAAEAAHNDTSAAVSEPTPSAHPLSTAELAAQANEVAQQVERPPPAKPPSAPPAATTELALIDRAALALRKGDHRAALRLLDEHLALYPGGVLQTERSGLRVLALCATGRLSEGRLERAAFLRAAGGTPLAARVRRACDAKDAP